MRCWRNACEAAPLVVLQAAAKSLPRCRLPQAVPSGTAETKFETNSQRMAIFHLTTQIISRGKGQSAIAAAAYRSGERLYDEQTAQQKHYSARGDRILFTDIMAPTNAPEWAHDRDQLWNHAERAEKRKDAQLAREIEVGLPHELTAQQREWLIKDFAREQFVRKGFAVDIAIHAPDRDSDDRNFHAHLLITLRPMGADGFAETKESDAQREARRRQGVTREQELGQWREQWANLANRHLERYGHEARIDHRSLKEQGIDREPTVHLGYAASEITARGGRSDRMDAFNEILARNELRFDLAAIDAELKGLEKEAADERRRQLSLSSNGPYHALKPMRASESDRVPPSPRGAMEETPDDEQQRKNAASKPGERPVAPTPAQSPQNRDGWRWSEAWGWEKVEDAASREHQQAAAKTVEQTHAPEGAKPTSGQEKPRAPQEPSPQQWGVSTSFIQTPQGYVPVVPIEHIAASQHAAARAQALAANQQPTKTVENRSLAAEALGIREQVRSDQRIDAQAARAAAQEEERRRYVDNYPYDRSRRLVSESQQAYHTPAQPSGQPSPKVVVARAAHAGQQIARGGFRVVNRATGVVSSLGDFLGNLLSSSPAEPQPTKITMRQLATDPNARRDYQLAQHAEAKRRGISMEALDDIRRDVEAGRDLSAADVSKLTRGHQEQILAKGDAYVRELIESSRKRADEYWKGRERERD